MPQPSPGGQQQSIFYQLANGEIPSKTIFENDGFRAILDKQPARPGHVLIIPKDQVQITAQFTPEMNAGLAEAIKAASETLLKGLDASGTSVFIANGGVAGQNAPQTLIHVIPRIDEDTVGLKPQPKQIPDEAFAEAANRLQEALGVQDQSGQQRQSQQQERQDTQRNESEDVDLDSVQDQFL